MARHSLVFILLVAVVTNAVSLTSADCSPDLEERLRETNCTCKEGEDGSNHVTCGVSGLYMLPVDLTNTHKIKGIYLEADPKSCLEPYGHMKLERMVLANWNIMCINRGTFSQVSVQHLDLSNNSFELGSHVFEGVTSLRTLILDNNPLHQLANDTFSSDDTPNLKRLQAANCHISQIEALAFNGSMPLEVIDLSNNRLTEVRHMGSLEYLKELDFSENKISKIENSSFQGMSQLVYLRLDHNRLTSLSVSDFNGLRNLTNLTLSFNLLTEINPHTFDSLVHLEVIQLDHNNLVTFTLDVDHFQNLKVLTLHHNRWLCDCQVAWMREHELVQNLNNGEHMKCNGPAEVRSQSIFEAEEKFFKCPHAPNVGHIVAGVAFALLGISVSLLVFWRWRVRSDRNGAGNHLPMYQQPTA